MITVWQKFNYWLNNFHNSYYCVSSQYNIILKVYMNIIDCFESFPDGWAGLSHLLTLERRGLSNTSNQNSFCLTILILIYSVFCRVPIVTSWSLWHDPAPARPHASQLCLEPDLLVFCWTVNPTRVFIMKRNFSLIKRIYWPEMHSSPHKL